MKGSMTRGMGLAVLLAATSWSAHATILSANFDDGTNNGFTSPTGGYGDWMVLQPNQSPWVSSANGVLWQTNTFVTTGDVGTDAAYVRRPGTLGGFTNNFSFTATAHVNALDPGASKRIGLVAFSNGAAYSYGADPKLELMLSGTQLYLFTEYVGQIAVTPFTASPNNDYTLRLSVYQGSLLGEVWNGTAAVGAPAAVVSGINNYPLNAIETGIGFISAGGSAYFDNVLLNEIVPEPGISLLLLTGFGLWRWKRTAKR